MARKLLNISNFLLATAVVLVWTAPAQAQLQVRYGPDGTMEITNRATGQSAEVPATASESRSPALSTPRERVYDDLIVEHARLNNVRPDLIRAVVKVESGFNPYARSPKGALGLMQLMPATARQLNVTNPFDPEQNIRGGSAYLRQLLDRYDNNEALALAAYNAGPGAVDKYGQAIPPYRETQQYVSKVTDIAGDDEGEVPTGSTTRFYKVVQMIDGREVVKYTTQKP